MVGRPVIGQHVRLALTGGLVVLAGVEAHLTTPARVMFMAMGGLFLIIGAQPAMDRLAAQLAARTPKRVEPVSQSPFQQQLALEAFDARRDVQRRTDTWKTIHDSEHGLKHGTMRVHDRCPWCLL